MSRYALPAFVLGAFCAAGIMGASAQLEPVHTEVSAQGQALIHILRANDEGEAVGESVTSPLVAFRVEEGTLSDGEFLECEQVQETRTEKDVSYHVVTFQHCKERGAARTASPEEAKLSVVGLDLTVKK